MRWCGGVAEERERRVCRGGRRRREIGGAGRDWVRVGAAGCGLAKGGRKVGRGGCEVVAVVAETEEQRS